MRVGVIERLGLPLVCQRREGRRLIVEDNKIRKFVKKSLYGAGVPKIEIERSMML